jgi:hypothetical protein
MRSETVTTVVDAPYRRVFDYVSDIRNLPEWATEFARELREDGDGYRVVNNLGEFVFEIRADEATGVIDMYAGPSHDQLAIFPTRAVRLPDGRTSYSFTMFQGAGMPNELFDSQHESLKREFKNIEAILGDTRA